MCYVHIFQALDSNFTEENRQKCAEAAKPLVEAVEELTTFASSPEFATKQAKISPKVGWVSFLPFILLVKRTCIKYTPQNCV